MTDYLQDIVCVMKKSFIFCLLLAIVSIMATGCSSCESENKKQESEGANYHDYDGVVQDFTAGVSHIQAMHRQTAYTLLNGKKYEWRNTRVIFNDTIDLDALDQLHITDINDVFYYWDEQGPWVQYVNSNVKGGLQIPWPINDVWIEDEDMSESAIKLSCEDALQRLKEYNATTNGIVPKACFITLRKPVGPLDCSPQWTIGDAYNVLFIDAETGQVRDWCPAFPSSMVNGFHKK